MEHTRRDEYKEEVFETSVLESSTMSSRAQKLVEDTLLAMRSGVHNAEELAGKEQAHQAENVNLGHKEMLSRGNEAGHRESFDRVQETNANKNDLVSGKDRDKLDWHAKKSMNVVGDSSSYQGEVKKTVTKSAKKKTGDIQKNVGKGSTVTAKNISKVADATAKGKSAKVEIQVETATGSKVDVKADASKGDIQAQVEEKTNDQQEKDMQSMSKEDKIRALRGLPPKDKNGVTKPKEEVKEKSLEAKKDQKRQKIAELKMRREHLGAGR